MGVAHDTFPRQCGNRQNKIVTMLNEQGRLYPLAQEFIAAIKEKVDEWLAENKA